MSDFSTFVRESLVNSPTSVITGNMTKNLRKEHPVPPKMMLSDEADSADESGTCGTVSSSDIYTDHEEKFDTIIQHLSSTNTHENHIGLQLLMAMIKADDLVLGFPTVSDAALAVVYGGEASTDEIQRLLGSFISEELLRNNDDDCWDDISYCSLPVNLVEEYYYDSEDEWSQQSDDDDQPTPLGRADGAFEVQALHIISRSLQQLISTDDSEMMRSLDFECSFWQEVIGALIRNLQNFDSIELAVVQHSLTVVHLLHTLHPGLVTKALQYTLQPFLSEITLKANQNKLEAIE
jgi:hypothetical protein